MRIAPGLFCFFYSDQPQNFCMKKTRLNLTVRNDEGKSMGWSSKPWQLCHCWLGTPRTLRRQQVCSDGQPRPGRARNVSLLCQALDHHRPGDGGSKKQKSHGAFQRPLDWNCRWAIKKRVGRWQQGDADSNRDAGSFIILLWFCGSQWNRRCDIASKS